MAIGRNLHGGRPFRFEWLLTLPLWHIDAVKGGGVHPIAYAATASPGRASVVSATFLGLGEPRGRLHSELHASSEFLVTQLQEWEREG